MPILDVTLPLSPATPVWPGDPPVVIRPLARIAEGDEFNLSELRCSTHAGTHIDAPWHFVETGAPLDAIPLTRLIGPCLVADLRESADPIGAADLAAAHIPDGTTRLLLRTHNSRLWREHPDSFVPTFTGLALDAADWLLAREIALVGIDYYSIEPFTAANEPVHRRLLGAGVIIIENLDLSSVDAGAYDLVCLPLPLVGIDGAPARVVLIRNG